MGWLQLPSICVMPSCSPHRGQAASVALAWPGMYDIFCLRAIFLFHSWPHLAFKRFTSKLCCTEEVLALHELEKQTEVEPGWNVDAFMRSAAAENKKRSVLAAFVIRMLGLGICTDTEVGLALTACHSPDKPVQSIIWPNIEPQPPAPKIL